MAGNFKAKVGAGFVDPDIICGRHELETPDKHEGRLRNFCQDHDLLITNTVFKHHMRRRYTWKAPGGDHRNQIDFILVKNRWKTYVENSRSYPGPECGSEHNLARAMVTPMVKETYNVEANNRFAALKLLDEDRHRNELFKVLKEAILTTTGEVLEKASKKIRKLWISDNTISLTNGRRALQSLCNSSEEGDERY